MRKACLIALFLVANIFAADQPAKILFFTKSARFEHDVIKQKDGKPSLVENVFAELGPKNNFSIETTKDGGKITAENLAKYDAIMFYTSGDLTMPQDQTKDKSPPMTEEGKAALLKAIKDGRPFICVHNALATFDKGKTIDPYIEMLGGESIGHDKIQVAKNICVDTKFPGCAGLTDGFKIEEEWYSNKNFAKDIHVILVQDTTGMTGPKYARPPYPASWARMYGKGRVFVLGMGHKPETWADDRFRSVLLGGISWALGRANADIAPNLETVTPNYAQMPAEKK